MKALSFILLICFVICGISIASGRQLSPIKSLTCTDPDPTTTSSITSFDLIGAATTAATTAAAAVTTATTAATTATTAATTATTAATTATTAATTATTAATTATTGPVSTSSTTTGGPAPILVGSTRTYKDPASALSQLKSGGTMILDDGVYNSVFTIPSTLTGWTIKSASGNPYKCVLNGRGGVGSGYNLAGGKGIIRAQGPGTIIGIGFINGGGGDGYADGEAGLYVENFASMGTLSCIDCTFDNCENGIFVPSFAPGSPGQNVHLYLENNIFSKNQPNGIITDGKTHNMYVNGYNLTTKNCIHYPSKYGNNLKSRSLYITINDQWNKHDQGRCLDIPSGGHLTVNGGVYTVVGPTAVANFISYCIENTNSGVYPSYMNGMTFYGGRFNDAIVNKGSATMTFSSLTQYWITGTNPSYRLDGPITGVVASPSRRAGANWVAAAPDPVLPWWATPDLTTTAAAAAATSNTAATSDAATTAAAASATSNAATTVAAAAATSNAATTSAAAATSNAATTSAAAAATSNAATTSAAAATSSAATTSAAASATSDAATTSAAAATSSAATTSAAAAATSNAATTAAAAAATSNAATTAAAAAATSNAATTAAAAAATSNAATTAAAASTLAAATSAAATSSSSTSGSSCPAACSGKGTCVAGTCRCESGFTGSDCGTKITSSASAEAITVNEGDWTYKLQESDSFVMWTAPITRRILSNETTAPTAVRSGLKIAAARNEFEPVQLVLPASSSKISITFSGMSGLSSKTNISLAQVGFSSGMADTLTPFALGSQVQLSSSRMNIIWITFYIPNDLSNLPAGWYNGTLNLNVVGTKTYNIPFSLYVFDFAISSAPNFKSQVNINVGSIVSALGSVDAAKQLLYYLRVAPTSVPWPSGLGYQISWDNSDPKNAANKCTTFNDEPYEGNQYSARWLTRRYAMGEGWLGTGFSANELFQFVDNATPRPSTFCGLSIGSNHYGNDAYNREWEQYLVALQNYVIGLGSNMIDKSYWYVQNEPQNDADYKLAAFLCNQTRTVAPRLKIAVSKEARKDIAERSEYGECGYDIWIAWIGLYDQAYAWTRQKNNPNEESWFYNLPQDAAPYFTPAKDDIGLVEGTNVRVIPWVSWVNRVTGYAYYNFGIFFDSSFNAKIGGILFREAFEDYEYLYAANGNSASKVSVDTPVDKTAGSVGTSIAIWNRNPNQIHALRWALGLFVEGTTSKAPMLETAAPPAAQPVYISFQDPNGNPTANPLVVGGKTWTKIGWSLFDTVKGYGWSGQYIGNSGIMLYGYRAQGGDPVQSSYIYNDYGRPDTFYYNLNNGNYNVTVGIGIYGSSRSDISFISLQGTTIYNQACCSNQLALSSRITVSNGQLTMVVGTRDQYTFLSWMTIVPV